MIIFTIGYFIYADIKNHQLLELNTWFGFIIAGVLCLIFLLLISEKIFIITYRRYMSRVSDLEPYVVKMITTFVLGFISIPSAIFILNYIITLTIF
jgi:hypothetical protein